MRRVRWYDGWKMPRDTDSRPSSCRAARVRPSCCSAANSLRSVRSSSGRRGVGLQRRARRPGRLAARRRRRRSGREACEAPARRSHRPGRRRRAARRAPPAPDRPPAAPLRRALRRATAPAARAARSTGCRCRPARARARDRNAPSRSRARATFASTTRRRAMIVRYASAVASAVCRRTSVGADLGDVARLVGLRRRAPSAPARRAACRTSSARGQLVARRHGRAVELDAAVERRGRDVAVDLQPRAPTRASISSASARRMPAAAIAADGLFARSRAAIASSNVTRSTGAGVCAPATTPWSDQRDAPCGESTQHLGGAAAEHPGGAAVQHPAGVATQHLEAQPLSTLR